MITIPTIKQLYDDILADIQSTYGSGVPLFGKVFLRAVAGVQAAKLKLFYLSVASLQKNIFVDTAEPEASGGTLERFGRIKLNRNPFSPVAGQYSVTVTGTIGAVIPANQTFKSNDNATNPGMLFILDVAYIMPGSTGTITIRALSGGLESRLGIGDGLTATSPIANVNAPATVTAEVVEPLAAEDIEEYRAKALEAYRLEPQGGAASDYRLWAADVQGVKQTYPYARSGSPNEINLYIEAKIADSSDGKGSPPIQMLTNVEGVVEFDPDNTKPLSERGRRPLGVLEVHYLPVTILQIDIVIAGFINLTPAIQTLLFNALKEVIDQVRPFVAACDIVANRNDILDTNKIISTILLARPGSSFGAVTMKVNSVATSTHTFINGEIPWFASVTYS